MVLLVSSKTLVNKTSMGLTTDVFKTSKRFLRAMIHRKKNYYANDNLVQNSNWPKKLWKTFKSVGLNSKEVKARNFSEQRLYNAFQHQKTKAGYTPT